MAWSTHVYRHRRLDEQASPFRRRDTLSPSSPKASRPRNRTTRTNRLRGSSPLSSPPMIHLSSPRARPWQQMLTDLRSKNPNPKGSLPSTNRRRAWKTIDSKKSLESSVTAFSHIRALYLRWDLHRSNTGSIWAVDRCGAEPGAVELDGARGWTFIWESERYTLRGWGINGRYNYMRIVN